MDSLKQKIKNTVLFDDEDKIAILTAIDSFSLDDLKALEGIIDEYDAKHKEVVSEFKSNILSTLDGIDANATPDDKLRLKQATDQIRVGLHTVLSD